MIRKCPDHGYVASEACPVCGADGLRVLGEEHRTQLSKFLSGALRHFPGDVGLSLNDQGWTDYDALVDAATANYDWATPERVAAVVVTDNKGRFEVRGGVFDEDEQPNRIRAAYGHSVDVTLESSEEAVPDQLYHGTAPKNLDAIAEEGLRPMGRQQVHLSETPAGAREVGRRHANDPVLLVVDAHELERDGVAVDARGEEIYTADRVPPAYVKAFDVDARDNA